MAVMSGPCEEKSPSVGKILGKARLNIEFGDAIGE
jgi:hypothetical protein